MLTAVRCQSRCMTRPSKLRLLACQRVRCLHADAERAIKKVVGDAGLSRNATVINNHGSIESGFYGWHAPAAVVYAKSCVEVQDILRVCTENKVSVVPYGAGTSVEGHLDSLDPNGIMLDVSQMNNILQVNEADMDARVQTGVTREQLNAHLRHSGLFFSVDPGANATIGGMTATNASGTTTLRYGNMKQNVIGMQVVRADGSVMNVGGRARKSSAGYDLTRLLIGSEGTLGVITEITVKLHPIPEAVCAAVCNFNTVDDAVQAVMAATYVCSPARMELLDEVTMSALNGWRGQSFAVKPTIFFEFHGSATSVEEQASAVSSLIKDYGGTDFVAATDQSKRDDLWKARHNAFWAVKDKWPGKDLIATDVCVPVSRLAESIRLAQEDVQKMGITAAPLFGHVGDGNFHMLVMFDSKDPADVEKVKQFEKALIMRALAMGGTCTGEHGIGTSKIKYLETEHGLAACETMAMIKRALDPNNLLNPGKIVPFNLGLVTSSSSSSSTAAAAATSATAAASTTATAAAAAGCPHHAKKAAPAALPSKLPGPASVKEYNSIVEQAKGGQYDLYKKLWATYGDVMFQSKEVFGADMVTLFHPDDIGTIFKNEGTYPKGLGQAILPFAKFYAEHAPRGLNLGRTNGPDWKPVRIAISKHLASPAAAQSYLAHLNSVLPSCIENFPNNDKEIDEYMAKVTYEMICSVLLGKKTGIVSGTAAPLDEAFIGQAKQVFPLMALLMAPDELPKMLNKPKHSSKIYDTFEQVMLNVMKYGGELLKELNAKAAVAQPDDLLHSCSLVRIAKESVLDEHQMSVNFANLIFAGVDTTSNLMQWMLYHVACDKRVQQKLRDEAKQVLGDKEMTAEIFNNLKYHKRVLKEVYRLTPPVYGSARYLDGPITIRGHEIPADTMLKLHPLPYLTNTQVFENPEAFIPERWARGDEETQSAVGRSEACPLGELATSPYLWTIPFSVGKRMCPGARLSELEVLMLFSRLLQTYSVSLKPDSKTPISVFKMGMIEPSPSPTYNCTRL